MVPLGQSNKPFILPVFLTIAKPTSLKAVRNSVAMNVILDLFSSHKTRRRVNCCNAQRVQITKQERTLNKPTNSCYVFRVSLIGSLSSCYENYFKHLCISFRPNQFDVSSRVFYNKTIFTSM